MPDETRETRLAATVETIVSAALKAEALDDEDPASWPARYSSGRC
jgi:hypothetical protein